ncbi:SID1 transmembrane family member 1 [Acropora cervicornis]|uniref:SID1 transmembrane family member 1 n=1 Tax=Acropora cervicornis TaxID=6130 RepID=A0AAD9QXH8_ACRCE|nr:SID1 transmembrane family member 1 [Acropora cervicornis]
MSVPHFQPANGDEAVLLNAEAYKRKYSFSIGYSFAWALIFEGCFSMLYHFCPMKLTFQFDSAFMFVISGLIVVFLYNGTSFKECTAHGKAQPPVHSNNFFLFFIVPLYIFNYFGSREQLQYWNENCFHYLSRGLRFDTFYWIGKKLFLNVSNFRDCDVLTKLVSFILALSFVAIVLPVVYKRNFPNIFLFGCIFSSLLAICGKVIVEFWRSDLSHWTVRKLAFHFLKGSYVLVTLGIMATAVWIFLAKATTNKEESPSESRDLNRNCAWLGFFDDHDLWHILSSFSLLMGSYLVLYISK